MKGSRRLAATLTALLLCSVAAAADEIRLKDGQKLYGTIVAFEDNMFKVQTSYGYVLVQKDKIASIIPSAPKTEAKPEAKPAPKPEVKAEPAGKEKKESVAVAKKPKEEKVRASSAAKAAPAKQSAAPATPPPAENAAAKEAPRAPAPKAAEPPAATPTAAPSEPELSVNREEVQGNFYINHTYGFQMYKAPGWNLIEGARRALPNAIVALGTSDQTTLMVIGRERAKQNLDAAASATESQLREAYENYRRIAQKKTTVARLPAIEYRYRGMADGHDWSGTLVTIARGNETFTILGMTYAATDLIQIQENVIARAIASLGFSAR